MTKQTVLVVMAAALVGGAGVAMYMNSAKQNSAVSTQASGDKAIAAPKFLDKQAQGGSPGAQPEVRAVSADIVALLWRSDNLKAFVEKAKQHPEKGGYAYAMSATLYCEGVRIMADRFDQAKQQAAASNKPTANARIAAVEELNRRCQGFTPADTGLAVLREGMARGDVVLAAKERLSQARTQPFDKQVAVAREVAQTRDMQVLQQLMTFASVTDEKTKDSVVYLDGQPYGGLTRQQYYAAADVMLCSFGMDCDSSRNNAVLEACAQQGRCAGSYLSLVQSEFRSKPEQWSQVLQVAQRMTQIVNTGGFEAFAPPRT
jgi:hypothetical protein